MSSMPRDHPQNAALAARLAMLEAERLEPVPRAGRSVAVDVDDLALLLHHLVETSRGRRHGAALSPAAACAYDRLDSVVRCHATAPLG